MHTKKNTPWLYIGPATFLLIFFLVYPSINTIYLSFLDYNSEKFTGIKNYIYCFTNEIMLNSFRNNILWVLVFVPLTVFLGLIIAVLVDRVRYESIVKSVIFMPMAISFVGAGVIWKFATGVIIFLVGLFVLISTLAIPGLTIRTLIFIIALAFILIGLSRIFIGGTTKEYKKGYRIFLIIIGMIIILISVIILLYPGLGTANLILLLSISLLLNGVARLILGIIGLK